MSDSNHEEPEKRIRTVYMEHRPREIRTRHLQCRIQCLERRPEAITETHEPATRHGIRFDHEQQLPDHRTDARYDRTSSTVALWFRKLEKIIWASMGVPAPV